MSFHSKNIHQQSVCFGAFPVVLQLVDGGYSQVENKMWLESSRLLHFGKPSTGHSILKSEPCCCRCSMRSQEDDCTPLESIRDNVRSAFHLVELQTKDKRGTCDQRDVPTVCRALGINPTQEQLHEILNEMSGDEESSGYVAFERFETVMIRALTDQRAKFVRDNEETILRAFRALDPNHQGFVEGDNLKKLLMSQGDAFDASEADEMIDEAAEKGSNRIYYEDFAALLARDGCSS